MRKSEAFQRAQLSLLYGETGGGASLWEQKPSAAPAAETAPGGPLPPFKKDLKAPFAHPYYWDTFVLIGNWK
jgi:CHAT domain-containing protein